MMRKTLVVGSGLCLALALLALPATAQDGLSLAPAQEASELQGWEQVGEGLWKRTLADGTVETEALGKAGLIRVRDQLNAELVNLVDAYLRHTTQDMADVLDTHLALIKRVEEGILNGPDNVSLEPAAASCTTSYSADAGGLSGCANFAQGDASYTGTSAAACFGLCDLYTYAYVSRTVCSGTVYTASQSCSKPGVINQSCHSYASLNQNGLTSCYAYGYSSIYCPDISWFRSASKTSTACGSLCLFCAPETSR